MMHLGKLLPLLALCIALPGCAVRGPIAVSVTGPESSPTLFADQVAALPEGAAQYFANSPFGPATIDAGSFYASGLGNECRSARATRENESHRFTVCREAGGAWRIIPTIFEGMPR